MANFGKIQLTNTGISTLVKAQAGESIVFTKIKMGSGTFDGEAQSLSELVAVQLTAEIVKGTMIDNAYTVEAHFTNEGLDAGFYWREIGLYVKDSKGNDALFGYANSGNTADYIPATASEIYSKHVRISVVVGDVQNITVEHTTGTYVDIVTFEESMSEKVDKVEGKGLSSNDYTDEERRKFPLLEASISEVNRSLTQEIETLKNTLQNYVKIIELNNVKSDLEKEIEDAVKELEGVDSTNASSIEVIQENIGTSNISSVGDGTITGAILALYNMIQKIPAITSGTSEPSGGKDGDVYVMYE